MNRQASIKDLRQRNPTTTKMGTNKYERSSEDLHARNLSRTTRGNGGVKGISYKRRSNSTPRRNFSIKKERLEVLE